MVTTPIVCPECGGDVQITAKVWLTMLGDGTIITGFDAEFVSEESLFYCANDHDLEQWAADNGLYDTMRRWIEARLTPEERDATADA